MRVSRSALCVAETQRAGSGWGPQSVSRNGMNLLPVLLVVINGRPMGVVGFSGGGGISGWRVSTPNGHPRRNLFRKKEDLLAVEFRMRVGVRGVLWGFGYHAVDTYTKIKIYPHTP